MLWKRATSEDSKMGEDKSLEVRFNVGGGFNKVGSFSEGSSPNEYEKQGHITVEFCCSRLTFTRSWGLERGYKTDSELTEVNSEFFSGQGTIRPSQWGRYSLSFLGSRRMHWKVDVVIRKGAEKSVGIVPMKAMQDIDLSWDEHFTLEVTLDEKAFSEFRDELRANPDFSAVIGVRLDGMRGLYTTWSPSISEGRVLKFLDDKKDVSNADQLTEGFEAVALGDPLAFRVSLGRVDDPEDDG